MACDQLSNWLLILLLGSLFTQLTIVICCPINNLSPFLSLFVQLATVTCSQRVMACDQLSNWLLILLLFSLFTQLAIVICCPINHLSPLFFFFFFSLFVQLAIVTCSQRVMACDQLFNWLLLLLLGSLFTQLAIVICCPINHLSLFLRLFVQLATVTCFQQVMARTSYPTGY